jgi:outer membrane protein assembly factor BamB
MTRIALGLLPFLAAIGTAAAPGPAQNWPQWRGPHADGVAPGANPPLHWDSTTNIKWKAPLTGRGSATPIVWGDQVFVVTAVPTDRAAAAADLPARDPRFEVKTEAPKTFYRFEVLSFDRETGALRWSRTAAEKVPHEGHHPSHSYAAGSPITDGQRLYVSFGSFGIYCYDLDGKPIWRRDLGQLHTRLGWGEAVTPVVHGDSLLLNWDQEADSALYCLDARTGETRWRTPREERSSWNTPLVVEHRGKTQVIVNATNRIRSYDLATGQEIWQCGGMTVNAIPSAVTDGETVYVMSGYQGSMAVAISLDAAGDVTDTPAVKWKHGRGTPYVPSPVLVNGRLYFTQANTNLLTCLDAATGKPLIDRERLPGATSFYASPIAAADRLYFVDQKGSTVVLKQADKLEVLATNKLDDQTDASPVAVGRQLFLRGEKYLYCIEARPGLAQ